MLGLLAATAPAPLIPITLLTTLMAWGVALGMLWIYRRTLSELLTGLADALDSISVGVWRASGKPLAPIAARLRRMDHSIIRAFETYILGCQITVGLFWDGITHSFDWVGQEIADLADTTAGAVGRIVRHSIPNAEKAAVDKAAHNVKSAVLPQVIPQAVAIPRAKAHADVLADRVGALSDTITNLAKRIRAQEKKVALGATAAAVMVALNSMGLRRIRCPNVRRNLQRFCSINPAILDAFFIGGLSIAGALSLERMTRELLGQMPTFEAALRRGFKEI